MMIMIPIMLLYQLVLYFWLLKINMSSHIQSCQYFMNLFHLVLSRSHSITTIEVTQHRILLISTELEQNLFVFISYQFLVVFTH